MMWKPKSNEIEIPFDPIEETLYRDQDPESRYAEERWSLPRGRTRFGEFPVVVVREHFRNLGFSVWASEPRLPDNQGFILVSYPGMRRNHHPAYAKMEKIFGVETLRELNKLADQAKIEATGNAGGGDPDLFVFSHRDQFFVEVKHRDQLNVNQLIAFPIIEQICGAEVRVARIVADTNNDPMA